MGRLRSAKGARGKGISRIKAVPRSGKLLLRNENDLANSAMLSFRFAVCGAGGGDGLVNDFRMTCRGKNGLRREDLFTKGASLSFGQSSSRTSRCDGRQLDGFFVFASEYPYEATHVAAFVPIVVKAMIDYGDRSLSSKHGTAEVAM